MIGYMYCMPFFSTFQSELARLCAFCLLAGYVVKYGVTEVACMILWLCIVLTSIFHTYSVTVLGGIMWMSVSCARLQWLGVVTWWNSSDTPLVVLRSILGLV